MFSNKSFDEFSKIVKDSLQKRAASLIESEEFQSSILIKEFEDAEDQKKPALTRQELLKLLTVSTYYSDITGRVISHEDISTEFEDEEFSRMYDAEFGGEDHVDPKIGSDNYEVEIYSGDVTESKNIEEKELTPAELKKREEVAKAIEKKNPDMPMDKKMAVATSVAKKVAESEDNPMKHRVGVTVSDPHSDSVSKRKETVYKIVKLSAESKEHAVERAKQHYKKKGYKVHDAFHINHVNESEESIDEGYVVRYNNPKSEQHGSEKHFDSKDAAQKHAARGNAVDKVGGKYSVHKVDAKGHAVKESEQLDELSKDTLKSYVKKSSLDAISQGMHAGAMAQRGEKGDGEKFNKSYDKAVKRLRGIDKATDRLTKEDCMSTATRKTFKQFKEEAKKDPCWKGYEQIGMKEKDGKQVPNCVPKDKK